MAIVSCPSCGTDVSISADRCPHCGNLRPAAGWGATKPATVLLSQQAAPRSGPDARTDDAQEKATASRSANQTVRDGIGLNRRDLLMAALTGLLALSVLWQFRFYTYQDPTGNLLKVNRFTGTVVPLRLYHEPQRPMRTWDDTTLPANAGGTVAHLRTKYAHGRLYYHLVLPMTAALKNARRNDPLGSYKIEFYDDDRFTLAAAKIALRDLIGLQDSQGTETELDGDGSIAMDVNSYDAISAWNLDWALSSNK